MRLAEGRVSEGRSCDEPRCISCRHWEPQDPGENLPARERAITLRHGNPDRASVTVPLHDIQNRLLRSFSVEESAERVKAWRPRAR